mmetsp:Transcript_38974/g.64168  ORF Transcript_38974/g.64168 Transcript_38974/m.64168 type:complete len:277 (-) Transcript_38974:122-952(-)
MIALRVCVCVRVFLILGYLTPWTCAVLFSAPETGVMEAHHETSPSGGDDAVAAAYSVIDANPEMSSDELRKCYKRAAFKVHPDRNKDPNAKEAFQRVADAYATVLKAKEKALADKDGVQHEVGVPAIETPNKVLQIRQATCRETVELAIQYNLMKADENDEKWHEIFSEDMIAFGDRTANASAEQHFCKAREKKGPLFWTAVQILAMKGEATMIIDGTRWIVNNPKDLFLYGDCGAKMANVPCPTWEFTGREEQKECRAFMEEVYGTVCDQSVPSL